MIPFYTPILIGLKKLFFFAVAPYVECTGIPTTATVVTRGIPFKRALLALDVVFFFFLSILKNVKNWIAGPKILQRVARWSEGPHEVPQKWFEGGLTVPRKAMVV